LGVGGDRSSGRADRARRVRPGPPEQHRHHDNDHVIDDIDNRATHDRAAPDDGSTHDSAAPDDGSTHDGPAHDTSADDSATHHGATDHGDEHHHDRGVAVTYTR